MTPDNFREGHAYYYVRKLALWICCCGEGEGEADLLRWSAILGATDRGQQLHDDLWLPVRCVGEGESLCDRYPLPCVISPDSRLRAL